MNECNLRAELGERLKQARAGLGLTQKELCLRVGLPLPSLKDYEACNRLPGAEALCAYASAGIRVDWLLTGDGPMLATDLVDPGTALDRLHDLHAAFMDYWHGQVHEIRREVALIDFVEAYNSGRLPHIPGFARVTTSLIDGANARQQPPEPAIDTQLLATCIKGVLLAEPGIAADKAAREAVDFYGRFQVMKMKKPEVA